VTAQLDHRVLATIAFLSVWGLWFVNRKSIPTIHFIRDRSYETARNSLAVGKKRILSPVRWLTSATHLVTIQVVLGITTLLYLVPIPLAALHQLTSLAVLTSLVGAKISLRGYSGMKLGSLKPMAKTFLRKDNKQNFVRNISEGKTSSLNPHRFEWKKPEDWNNSKGEEPAKPRVKKFDVITVGNMKRFKSKKREELEVSLNVREVERDRKDFRVDNDEARMYRRSLEKKLGRKVRHIEAQERLERVVNRDSGASMERVGNFLNKKN